MGLDISLKLNKQIESVELKNQFYAWNTNNSSDDICCLSRAYCGLMLMQFDSYGNEVVGELNRVLEFDCSFLQEPKPNHVDEKEDTLFKFGWVNTIEFLGNLKKLEKTLQMKPDFSQSLNVDANWKNYFNGQGRGTFFEDITNLIKVLEIGNEQGLTEICYVVNG